MLYCACPDLQSIRQKYALSDNARDYVEILERPLSDFSKEEITVDAIVFLVSIKMYAGNSEIFEGVCVDYGGQASMFGQKNVRYTMISQGVTFCDKR